MLISLILVGAHLFNPVGPSDVSSSKEAVLTKPSFLHVITLKHAFLDTLELEDRSVWTIAPPDIYKTVLWEAKDSAVLSPNFSFFSTYKFQYYLTNTSRDSYARVNLVSHPCDYGRKSRWVSSLDTFSGRLFLNDGSRWKVDPADINLFELWGINDFIVYGKNDQLFSQFPFLLINARLNHSIRAVEF